MLHSIAPRSLRASLVIVGLSLSAFACGGGVPSRAELLKALDKAGLDNTVAECVADDVEGKDELMKAVASGKNEPEMVDIMAKCMLADSGLTLPDDTPDPTVGATDTTVAEVAVTEPVAATDAGPAETTAPPADTTPPADTVIAGSADGDADAIAKWQVATGKLILAEPGDQCLIREALETWASTPFPTTLLGAQMLNNFELVIIPTTQYVFSETMAPEQGTVFDQATSALVDASTLTDVAAFLAADQAAYSAVAPDVDFLVTEAGC